MPLLRKSTVATRSTSSPFCCSHRRTVAWKQTAVHITLFPRCVVETMSFISHCGLSKRARNGTGTNYAFPEGSVLRTPATPCDKCDCTELSIGEKVATSSCSDKYRVNWLFVAAPFFFFFSPPGPGPARFSSLSSKKESQQTAGIYAGTHFKLYTVPLAEFVHGTTFISEQNVLCGLRVIGRSTLPSTAAGCTLRTRLSYAYTYINNT